MPKIDNSDITALEFDRLLWKYESPVPGPVLVIFAGIHGNEPAGIRAVNKIADSIEENKQELTGSVYAITGNIQALNLGIRYVDFDLNRLWESFHPEKKEVKLNHKKFGAEREEIIEIEQAVHSIIKKYENRDVPIIFTDIHTTSSSSCSFILFNDTLGNRQLAGKFPSPQILGVEEYIKGTLLSYINNLGHTAIGFEAGAHTAKESVIRSEAFLWLLLHNCNFLKLQRDECAYHENKLRSLPEISGNYFEIIYHHYVEDPEVFEMKHGFKNFDPVRKGELLAIEDGEKVTASMNGRIFMPLYQQSGNDGFFIIREISPFWLTVSAYLRKSFIHKYLKYLPGVTETGKNSLKINLRVARFLVRHIFHLLGYRIIRKDEHTLVCFRR